MSKTHWAEREVELAISKMKMDLMRKEKDMILSKERV